MKKYPIGSWQEAIVSYGDEKRLEAAKHMVGELAKTFAEAMTDCSNMREPERSFTFATVSHVMAGYMAMGNSELLKLANFEKAARSADQRKGWAAAYEFWSDVVAISKAGLKRAQEMAPGLAVNILGKQASGEIDALIKLDAEQPHPPNN